MVDDWIETTVGDDVNLLTGYPFKSRNYTDTPRGIRLVRGDNVVQGCLRWDGAKRWPCDAADALESYFLQQDDVVLAMDRPWIEAGLKYAAISKDDLPAMLVQRVARLRGGKNLHTRFLKYVIGSVGFTNHILAVQTGTAVPHISSGQIKSYCFRRPPLHVQRRIAHILGTLDDKIELNRKTNETLEAMARVIFKSWFVDFNPVHAKAAVRREHPKWSNEKVSRVALPNLEPAIAELFPDAFVDSESGKIPTGWTKTTIGEETEFLTGFAFKSKSFSLAPPGVRLARGDNIKEGVFHWKDKSRYWPEVTPDLERYVLNAGDVLIGMDGSKVGKNWVRVRPCDLPCLLVQRVARLRSKGSVGQNSIWILVGSQRFREFVNAVKTGTSIPHISGGQIQSYDFVKPTPEDPRILNHFEEFVTPLTNQVDSNHEENRFLTTSRDSLLPKLLSGELSVT